LNGWSKSQSPDAAERAEALLMRMQHLYRTKQISDPPNLFCYNSVLNCWTRAAAASDGSDPSVDRSAAQRAEDLMRGMMQRRAASESDRHRPSTKKSNSSLQPNRISWNTVMNAWANEGNWMKVQSLFQELQGYASGSAVNYDDDDDDPFSLTPDSYTYRTLWKAIQNTNDMTEEQKRHTMTMLAEEMTKLGMDVPDKVFFPHLQVSSNTTTNDRPANLEEKEIDDEVDDDDDEDGKHRKEEHQ
jgi:hypothetical protein